VHPGWDETKVAQRDNRPNPSPVKDRAGGQFLASSFNGAVASGANVIMIGTWNEYAENSHIEPSNLYGTQSLDTLRPLIASWEGQAPAPQPDGAAGTPAGAVVTARTVLNVRTAPSLDGEIIGKAPAGGSYGFIVQEGTWYKIDFNGQQAY